jgi:hypothetical protein
MIAATLDREKRPLSVTQLARAHGIERDRNLYRHFASRTRSGLIERVGATVHPGNIEYAYALTALPRAATARQPTQTRG